MSAVGFAGCPFRGAVRRDLAAGALIFGLGLGIGALAGARPDAGLTPEDGMDAGTPWVTPSAPHVETPYSGMETITPPFFFVDPEGASPSHRDVGGWAI